MREEKGQVFGFGDFIFHSRSGDLTKNGTRIRLNKQTAELLTVLLANAGSVVTRSQIRETLWPEPQVLNYEKVISNGIGKLRHAFRDDSRNPRYIECIPKRGYRILSEVRLIGAPVVSEIPLASSTLPSIAFPSENTAIESEAKVADAKVSVTAMAPASSAIDAQLHHLDAIPSRPVKSRWSIFVPVFISLFVCVFALIAYPRIRSAFHKPVPPPLASPGIAVLSLGIAPFETHSNDAEELGSSFRLDLTDALSQLPQVRIRAANSMENLKPDSADLSQEAIKLHLDTILFGRLTLKGRDFHLQLELVRGSDAAHIATLQYHGTRDELVTVRDKIQQEIFTKLRLPAAEQANAGETNNPRAYEAYLNGRYHYLLQTNESLRQAAADFNAAIDDDPRFARAYAALGRTYLVMGTHSIIPRQEGLSRSSIAIDRAQMLDPAISDVHAVRGLILLFRDWDATGAERELRQAIQIDPNQAMYHAWLARVLVQRGNFEQAHHEIAIAHDDDPYNIPVFITEAYVDQNAREYPQMLQTALKAQELMHGSPLAMDIVANALWAGGNFEEAITEWRNMALKEKDAARARMEDLGLVAFHKDGVKGYALVRLDAIRSRKDYPLHANDFSPVEWYAAAGNDKEALAALRQSLAAHDPEFLDLMLIPSLDRLRRSSEYQQIVSEGHVG